MAYYERWRTQHDADEFLEQMGFQERLIHGVRLYYNSESGECLDLHRSKQLWLKTLQHGVHISEGLLERLVETVKEENFDDDTKKVLRKFVLEEKNKLNKILDGQGLTDNF